MPSFIPYTPINVYIFCAAYAGAIGGQGSALKVPSDAVMSSPGNVALATSAGAFAVAMDQAYANAATPDQLIVESVITAAMGVWAGRVDASVTQGGFSAAVARYLPECLAIVAGIEESDGFATTTLGVSLPAWGSGGGGGFTPGGDLSGTSTDQTVVGINTVPVNTADNVGAQSDVWVFDTSNDKLNLRRLTSADIFNLSVSLSGGGAGTFEVGQTWTPGATLVANPACNDTGVTMATLADTVGHSGSVLGDANPLNPPVISYTENAQGATVGIGLTLTQNGVTAASNEITSTWTFRHYAGCDDDDTGTSIVEDGNNATLVGGVDPAGALVGGLGAGGAGTSFSITPSGTQYGYYACVHTASALTFKDQNNNPFPMTRVGNNFSFTNQYGQSTGFDLYVSGNALTVPYTLTVQ